MSKRTAMIVAAGVLLAIGLIVWFRPATSTASIVALARPGQADLSSLSARVIPQDDLPPAGTRSLFDHLVAQNNSLPYPFEKLVEMVRARDPDNQSLVSVLLPHGRSLLKAMADDRNPRAVVGADFQVPDSPTSLGLAPRGQLFMGFVPNAHEVEILSYNEAAGRYDFQLIQNYCDGCVPRIIYAPRAICTACHQGGGPIFPVRPWNETNGQPDTAAAIAKARGSDAPFMGIALRQPLSSPERFQQLVDQGNFINATQRLWLDGCGESGNACRRLMFKLALRYADSPGSFDDQSADAQALRKLQAASFPKNGIAVAESDLNNRDPLGERQGIKGWWRSLWTRDIKPGEGARDNEDLAAFDKLPKMAPDLDPLTVRQPKQLLTAQDVDGVYGLAALFTDSDIRQLEEGSGYHVEGLLARVDALPDDVFAPKPVSRVRLMQALLGGKPGYCCLDTSQMSPPMAGGVATLKIVKHPELKPFETYCFACHRGNPSQMLNFMAGATEDDVLANIRGKTQIRDVLDWERYEGTDKAGMLMPPRTSLQYARFKAAGAEGDKERAAMRAVVPSLFGF